MPYLNNTRNQHFISQTELRLNAINPNAKKGNQKIYSFEVTDRESYSSRLNPIKGRKINTVLSFDDLFSFDVLGKNERLNFEKYFARYESKTQHFSENLLSKLSSNHSDIHDEIINLYVVKFLNFIRNPYSVEKILNSFPMLKDLRPVSEPYKSRFEKILAGNKPHKKHLCSHFEITDQQYTYWLSTLFMLLSEFQTGEPNFIEEVIRGNFEDINNVTNVTIYTYDNHACVISDKGYTDPISNSSRRVMAFDFNISANSFIRYVFADLELVTPTNMPKKAIDLYKARKKQVNVYHRKNDMEALKTYNQRSLYQCHKMIYSSSTENYGL